MSKVIRYLEFDKWQSDLILLERLDYISYLPYIIHDFNDKGEPFNIYCIEYYNRGDFND